MMTDRIYSRPDYWSRRAKKANFRSRAVWKLEEIDRRWHLFRSGMNVVDLGAAPGSWSQFARRRVGAEGRVIAVDLQVIEPIEGVDLVQGDFRTSAVMDEVLSYLGPHRLHLVLSDLAPKSTGVTTYDQSNSEELMKAAIEFALKVLDEQGSLLLKAFHGSSFAVVKKLLVDVFETVRNLKPAASRARSREVYLLGSRLRKSV